MRSRDDLIASVGALQTVDAIDDGADALDHALVLLCGAIDVIARSIHSALRITGSERHAKLHTKGGYDRLLGFYSDAQGKPRLDQLQPHLGVVFSLRNSIHSRTLEAIAALHTDTDGNPRVNEGHLDIVIPQATVDDICAEDRGGLAYWGARELGNSALVVADLSQLVDRSFATVLEFLDHLCRMIAAEWTLDKDPVLQFDVLGASPQFAHAARPLRLLIGMPRADDFEPRHTPAE